MDIGLRLPLGEPFDVLTEIARRGESAGADSVWVGDHLVWPTQIDSPYPYSTTGAAPLRPDVALFDPWICLAAVAAATTRVKLATGVYILPLRPALVTARAVATLDVLSGGRVLFGVGVGWMREEFEAAGVPFDGRGAVTDELIRAMRALWAGGEVSFEGDHVQVPPIYLAPPPVQGPQLGIHVGGETRRALRRASELGDGWISMHQSPDDVSRIAAELDELRTAAGRERQPFDITVLLPWPVTRDQVDAFAAAGATRGILTPWRAFDGWEAALDAAEASIGELVAIRP